MDDKCKNGFIVVSSVPDARSLDRPKVMVPVANVAYVIEPPRGVHGNCLLQIKNPPSVMPISQKFEEVSRIYQEAMDKGGIVVASDLQNNNAVIANAG